MQNNDYEGENSYEEFKRRFQLKSTPFDLNQDEIQIVELEMQSNFFEM